MARELYGPELMKQRVLELNASHERGIDVIRDKVKSFAQLAVGTATTAAGFPCPPFKIIILDEADSMTRDAQSALRRTMEMYAKVTRFCIICNYVSRIIDPITSRCAKFRYKPLSSESMRGRLAEICAAERIKASPAALDAVIAVSEGDMRKSVNTLQTAYRLGAVGGNVASASSSSSSSSGASTMDDGDGAAAAAMELTAAHVHEVAGQVPETVVRTVWTACGSGRVDVLEATAKSVIRQGYPVDQVLAKMLPIVIGAGEVSEIGRAQVCTRMAEADKKLIEGADELLQLMDVMSIAASAIEAKARSA